MTAVWASNLSSGKKLVALALADCADDDGRCWPSVDPHLVQKCSMCARAIQNHLAALVIEGILARTERPGRSTLYIFDPRKLCTPADSAPPQNMRTPPQNLHPTPADSAGAPAKSAGRTTNIHHRSTTTPGAMVDQVREYVMLAEINGQAKNPAGLERHLLKNGLSESHIAQLAAWRREGGGGDLTPKAKDYRAILAGRDPGECLAAQYAWPGESWPDFKARIKGELTIG